jgi:hypothetical protein
MQFFFFALPPLEQRSFDDKFCYAWLVHDKITQNAKCSETKCPRQMTGPFPPFVSTFQMFGLVVMFPIGGVAFFFVFGQENVKTKHPQLHYESKLYMLLQGGSKLMPQSLCIQLELWNGTLWLAVSTGSAVSGVDLFFLFPVCYSWHSALEVVWC